MYMSKQNDGYNTPAFGLQRYDFLFKYGCNQTADQS